MLRTCALLLLLVLCGAQAALAERTIVCAASADMPPMEFLDKDDGLSGYVIDMLRAAGRIAGFKAEFKTVAREALVSALQAGEVDAICSSAGLGGEELKALAISMPYHVAKEVLVVNDETAIYSSTSLAGQRIGILPATPAETVAGAKVTTYGALAGAMEDLYVKRLDGVVCDDAVGTYFASVKYQDKLKVTGYLGVGRRIAYSVAVKPGDQEALTLLNQGISGIQARAIDKELQLKWLSR